MLTNLAVKINFRSGNSILNSEKWAILSYEVARISIIRGEFLYSYSNFYFHFFNRKYTVKSHQPSNVMYDLSTVEHKCWNLPSKIYSVVDWNDNFKMKKC